MATIRINEKQMLNLEDLVANATSDITISKTGEATYTTAAGNVVKKGITGLYSTNADNFNAIVNAGGSRIHANDAEIALQGTANKIIIKDYFSTNGSKVFTVASYDTDGAGVNAFSTNLVAEAFLVNRNQYNEYNLAENHNVDGRITTSKITGTSFNDTVDLSDFSAAQLKDAKGKDIASLTINTGKGNDTIRGSLIDDVITGGEGRNTVRTSGDTNLAFGNDKYKLTKGEDLVIEDGTAVQQYHYSTDGKDATVTAYHHTATETAVNTAAGANCYTYNPATDDYAAAGAPVDVYALTKGAEQSIATADKYSFAEDGTITKEAADAHSGDYKTVDVGAEVAINVAGGTINMETGAIAQKGAVAADTYYDNVQLGAEVNYGNTGYVAGEGVFTNTAAAGENIYLATQDDVYAAKLLDHIQYNEGTQHWEYKAGNEHKIYTAIASSGNQDAEHLVAADTLATYLRYDLTNAGASYTGKASEATKLYILDGAGVGATYTALTENQTLALVRNNLTVNAIAAGTVTAMRADAAGKALYLDNGAGSWVVSNPTARYNLAGTDAYTGKASDAAFLYTVNAGDVINAVADKMVYARYKDVTESKLGTVTIDNLARQNIANSIELNGTPIANVQWTVTEDFSKKTSYTGSWLNETVDASESTKGVTVNTAAGNDIIVGSAYSDNITGGAGNNQIDYTSFITDKHTFGADTVKLTAATKTVAAERLDLDLSSVVTKDQVIVSKVKNDIVVDVLKAKATITDSVLTAEGATYKYNTVTQQYDNEGAMALYTDAGHTVAYTNTVSSNINGLGKWVTNLYDAEGNNVIVAGNDADNRYTYERFTLDGILVKEGGKYASLGTVTLKDLGNKNQLADVRINDGALNGLFTHIINMDATKDKQFTATIGHDLVYSTAEHATDVTYTNAGVDVHDFVDAAGYTLSAGENSFTIADINIPAGDSNNSVDFVNTNTTIVDASKAKYAVSASAVNADLSKSKGNNLLLADQGVALDNSGLDVKTSKGNDVVILKSVAGAGKQNTIDYIGGNDAYQGSAGKETYTVKSMDKNTALSINDLGGNADTLDFSGSGATFQKMTVFFDMNNASQTTQNDGLLIISNDAMKDSKALTALLNGTGKGGVEIDNYFTAAQNLVDGGGNFNAAAKGNGYIETVKQDGAALGGSLDAKVAEITANVAAWLANNANYDSAMEVINSGNKADIESLMLCYQAGTVA